MKSGDAQILGDSAYILHETIPITIGSNIFGAYNQTRARYVRSHFGLAKKSRSNFEKMRTFWVDKKMLPVQKITINVE